MELVQKRLLNRLKLVKETVLNWYIVGKFAGEILQKIRGNFQVFGNILGKFCSLNLATLHVFFSK